MQAKRERVLTPGFTVIPNRRVDAAIQLAFAELMIQQADKIANGTASIADLQVTAVRQVARTLPPPRMCRGAVRPSKNDNPIYRKDYVRDFRR